ncbi:MAG: bifunctional nuclease domain-containing protein [Pseudobdellovibrionaceae bacterium]
MTLVQENLLELTPAGMAVGPTISKPVMILKDKNGESLPVPLTPLEAGVALSQSSKTSPPATPHRVLLQILTSMNIVIEKCVFTEIKGSTLYVELALKNHPSLKTMEVRADEAMSLCLFLEVPIYATRSFMMRSRDLEAEMSEVEKGKLRNPKLFQRTHSYLM